MPGEEHDGRQADGHDRLMNGAASWSCMTSPTAGTRYLVRPNFRPSAAASTHPRFQERDSAAFKVCTERMLLGPQRANRSDAGRRVRPSPSLAALLIPKNHPLQYLRQLVARNVFEDLRAGSGLRARLAADEHITAFTSLPSTLDVLAQQTDVGERVVPASGRTAGPVRCEQLVVREPLLEVPRGLDGAPGVDQRSGISIPVQLTSPPETACASGAARRAAPCDRARADGVRNVGDDRVLAGRVPMSPAPYASAIRASLRAGRRDVDGTASPPSSALRSV